MGSSDDDGPDAQVSQEVGIAGLILFAILLILTGFSVICAKNKYSWRMFVCSTAMSLLELPRYIALIVQKAYVNRWTYVFHMIASVAFFAAFTCVIYIMHDAVDLSQSHSPLTAMITNPKSLVDRIVIDKTALAVLNLLFALLTLITSVSCILYNDLENYFHNSLTYKIFTIADVFKNLAVASAFLFYGCRLRGRINIFYDSFGLTPATGSSSTQELELLVKLKTVVRRLLIVMSLCLVSFLLRTVMLVIKGITVEERIENLDFMPSYGTLWWILSDFIPRGLPILSFVIFFGGQARVRSRENSNSKTMYGGVWSMSEDAAGTREALLSRLHNDDDDDEDDENPGREYDEELSSQGGSGHHYAKINSSVRESAGSMDSYETSSSSHTVNVFRNTATTGDFSTSYRPARGRKSESSSSYFTGSIIVNALMWPIGSSSNPYRNASADSAGKITESRSASEGDNDYSPNSTSPR